MLAAHPLSRWLRGLQGFLLSPTQRSSCYVFPCLCHPLPSATSSDNAHVFFSRDPSEISSMRVEGSVRASTAPGLSSIVLRIIWQPGRGQESCKSCQNQAGSWVRMWPQLRTAVRKTRTLAINTQNCFVSWLLVCKRGGCSECSSWPAFLMKATAGIAPLPELMIAVLLLISALS